jgi:nitrogen fixation protein FixH
MSSPASSRSGRPLTGRTVFLCLLGFFGVVAAVNGVLVRAATSTFGGIETENAYKAGLNFGRDIAAARAQDALHWHVDGKVALDASGTATTELTINDENGQPVNSIEVTGQLLHPTDRKLDHTFAMVQTGLGHFRGTAAAAPGQWDFVISIDRNSERAFQSRTRVLLK